MWFRMAGDAPNSSELGFPWKAIHTLNLFSGVSKRQLRHAINVYSVVLALAVDPPVAVHHRDTWVAPGVVCRGLYLYTWWAQLAPSEK